MDLIAFVFSFLMWVGMAAMAIGAILLVIVLNQNGALLSKSAPITKERRRVYQRIIHSLIIFLFGFTAFGLEELLQGNPGSVISYTIIGIVYSFMLRRFYKQYQQPIPEEERQ